MSEIQAIRERHEFQDIPRMPFYREEGIQAHADRATLLSALTAAEARAEAAEARVKAAQGEADMIRACCDMFERAINEGDPKAELLIRVQEIREAATRTLKGTPDGR